MDKILIVDDDLYIGNLMEEILVKAGYEVFRAYSGTEAVLFLSGRTPDLILLDLMLPGISGEEVLSQINGIPVLVVSAKLEVDDKVKVLLGGAADYITKPFDTKELLARIAVQLRNREFLRTQSVIMFEDIVLDSNNRRVTVADKDIKLTKTEYAILKVLISNRDRVVAKSSLLGAIADDTPDCTESSLKIHVANLRRKLRDAGSREYIESVWGIGFKMKTE